MRFNLFDVKISDQTAIKLGTVKKILRIFEIVLFILLFVINLAPFFWGLITSLKPIREVVAYPPKFFGFDVSLEHYQKVFGDTFFTGFKNSVFYSFIAILFGLLLALMAAYAMHRFRFAGKKAFFILILTGIPLAIGSAAMVVPNYTFFARIGITDRWYTLPLIYLAYNLPMAIWIMLGGMETVPVEIDEAAKIDGAGRWYIIFRIVLPLMLPAIASSALFIFLGAWNEFVVSSVLVSSSKLYPIQVSIYNYIGYYGIDWGPLTAAATAAVFPTLIVFSILGRLLISGLTAGAVKD
ncbi:MAG: carbohydrate ABC transporter permease [Clostridiaceae bacterium]|mgnify:CR=1 FL=1|nr:carbohydrate ABC transporter permease [Clostridiaceae bacterium]